MSSEPQATPPDRPVLRRVCVFAGSSTGTHVEYESAARHLGVTLALRRLGMVYGGARVGLMGVAADSALDAGGEVIGVIPASLVAREIAHPGLTELRVVSSMHERKATMADLSDAFIALPGGWGTLEEFFEVLTWTQLGLHRKPCGLLNARRYFDRLLSFLEHSVDEGFVKRENGSMIAVSESPDALLDRIVSSNPPLVDTWIDRAST